MKESSVPQNRAGAPKWIAYALAVCLLIWSLVRLLTYSQKIRGGPFTSAALYWLLVTFVAALTTGWAIVGYLLLPHWHQIKGAAVDRASRSRIFYWLLWMVPALLWFTGFLLYRVSATIDASLVDGPVLVLISGGIGVQIFLISSLSGTEGAKIDLLCAPTESGRPESSTRPVPARMATAVSILTVSAIPLLIFRRALFNSNSILFGGDVERLYYMFEKYIREAVHAGHLPLWNPYLFSGSPALSHPQYLVFYPPQILLRLLPLNLSLSWAVAVHVWIAGIGTFALCRRLGLQRWICIVCALVYMLNSGMMLRVYAGHWWLIYALAWIPLVWLLIMIALDTGRAMAIVGASAGVALIILTGHPTFPMYILLFFGLYWIYVCGTLWRNHQGWGPIRTATLRFISVMALALGLSAIQLVPSAVMYGQISVVDGYDPNQANFLALSVPDLLAILIPRFSTSPVNRFFYWEHVPYLGTFFVLLSPFVLMLGSRDSFACFLGTIATIALAIAFGESLGIFPLLYYLVPLFRVSRIPPRALVMWIPALTLLGGLGLRSVSQRSIDRRWFGVSIRAYTASCLFILFSAMGHWHAQSLVLTERVSAGKVFAIQLFVIGSACILIQGLLGASRKLGLPKILVWLLGTAVIGYLAGVFVVPSDQSLTSTLLTLGLFLGTSVVLARFFYRYGLVPLGGLLVIVLVCLDLGKFGLPHILVTDPPVFYQEERLVLHYADLQQFGRILSTEGQPNQYALGHLSHVDGFNTGILQGYDQFLRSVSTEPGIDTSTILSRDSQVERRALDFLGVEYVITTKESHADHFTPIASRNGYYLYENPRAYSRAYVVYDVYAVDSAESATEILTDRGFDYARSVVLFDGVDAHTGHRGQSMVSIDEYVPYSGNLTMTVHTSEPGVLVMSEPYYSERRAWVDEEERDLLRANLGFCAVALPAGTHTVEVRYVPIALYIGLTITALALLTCVGIVFGSRLGTWCEAQK